MTRGTGPDKDSAALASGQEEVDERFAAPSFDERAGVARLVARALEGCDI
jgi:hypothetical protein